MSGFVKSFIFVRIQFHGSLKFVVFVLIPVQNLHLQVVQMYGVLCAIE